MPIRLDTSAPDFAASFKAFLATKREVSEDVEQVVRAIIADVVARGDQALVELTRRFGRRSMRSPWHVTASRPITAASFPPTIASATASASSSARAGPPSRRSGCTFRAAPPPIRPRCS